MEQKQLDEIDESYFGDEFIDEDLVKVEPIRKDDKIEEIKIESVEDTNTSINGLEPKSKKKSKKVKTSKVSSNLKADPIQDKVEVVDDQEKVKENTSKVEDVKNFDPDREVKSEVEKIKVTDTKISKDESKNDFNPWDEKKSSEKGLFTEVSTWKTITGIAIILLIFSVFTQGFQFSENGNELTGAAIEKIITVEQAEERVLKYVNTQLLQPPFLAEVVKTTEGKDLYKLTLSIAGEEIDSFLTKDGRIFFPQGFDISYSLSVEEVIKEDSQLDDVPEIVVEVVDEETEETSEVVDEETPEVVVEESPEVVVDMTGAKKLSISAKKWLFSPHQLKVNQGDTVSLTIEPTGLDFTFIISDLGVEKEVSGTTAVEFVATKKGSFEFSCSSCEEWRGMVGTIEVE